MDLEQQNVCLAQVDIGELIEFVLNCYEDCDGARGGLKGATAPCRKHLAPRRRNFRVFVGGNFANDV